MKTSEEGLRFIRESEGLRVKAYRCPAGVLSIGIGHTGPDVKEGMVITSDDAFRLLRSDLAKLEVVVNDSVTYPIEQCQFDALMSLIYNIGPGAFRQSTLLKYLNQGNLLEASNQFLVWTKAGGRRVPGLAARRERERQMFLKGIKHG